MPRSAPNEERESDDEDLERTAGPGPKSFAAIFHYLVNTSPEAIRFALGPAGRPCCAGLPCRVPSQVCELLHEVERASGLEMKELTARREADVAELESHQKKEVQTMLIKSVLSSNQVCARACARVRVCVCTLALVLCLCSRRTRYVCVCVCVCV